MFCVDITFNILTATVVTSSGDAKAVQTPKCTRPKAPSPSLETSVTLSRGMRRMAERKKYKNGFFTKINISLYVTLTHSHSAVVHASRSLEESWSDVSSLQYSGWKVTKVYKHLNCLPLSPSTLPLYLTTYLKTPSVFLSVLCSLTIVCFFGTFNSQLRKRWQTIVVRENFFNIFLTFWSGRFRRRHFTLILH